VNDLYKENYKTLKKEIAMVYGEWEDHGLVESA
jgi:hypothetical protein